MDSCDAVDGGGGGVFKDINKLRQGDDGKKSRTCCLGLCSTEPTYNETPFAWLAQNKKFEATTFIMIGLNAVAIGHDADYTGRYGKPDNLYDGPWGFIMLENAFAGYFTFEVGIRFFAFKRKTDCFTDSWFVFDACLVTLMVVETWILPLVGGGSFLSQLSALRLLRLLRISRMARLMRAVPQLVVIVKGIAAATRTVLCTGVLLVLVSYTFAILFTSEFHEGVTPNGNPRVDCGICELAIAIPMPDCEFCIEEGSPEERFGTMGKSFFSLYVMGTVLDDVTSCTDAIRSSGKAHMLFAFIVFIIIASFTMLNMLVGVLCEVVNATTDAEAKSNLEQSVSDAIQTIFQGMDENDDKMVSRDEFEAMKDYPQVMAALGALDIDDSHFQLYGELFFKDMPSVDFKTLFNMILRLRPGTTVGALDFATFQRHLSACHHNLQEKISRINAKIRRATMMVSRSQAGANGELVCNHGGKLSQAELLQRVEEMSSADITAELRRRLGITDLAIQRDVTPGYLADQNPGFNAPLVVPETDWTTDIHTC